MLLHPENPVLRYCAEGMNLEASKGKTAAGLLFRKAWELAVSDPEYCIAAHYLARAQNSIAEKLDWDQTALRHARNSSEDLRELYPSLYLNIAKNMEDLGDYPHALQHYETALTYVPFLADDGYGRMISGGIRRGLDRVQQQMRPQ